MSTAEQYISERLDNEVKWYSKKASDNRIRFHASQIIIIVAGALIPIVNLFETPSTIGIISSILAGVVIISGGISQLQKSQENWVLFRSTAEMLKKEKQLYLNSVGFYANIPNEDKHKLLVERVESIISSENTKFFVTHSEKPKKD